MLYMGIPIIPGVYFDDHCFGLYVLLYKYRSNVCKSPNFVIFYETSLPYI